MYGAIWITLGILFITGWFPGSDSVADGPRIGLAVASWMFAGLVLGIPLTLWYVRKFTRPEDYDGNCPVGNVCTKCETFNFNPRTKCKDCGSPLEPATGERRLA